MNDVIFLSASRKTRKGLTAIPDKVIDHYGTEINDPGMTLPGPVSHFAFAALPSSDGRASQGTADKGNHGEHDEDEEENLRRIVRHTGHQAEAKEGGKDGDHQE
jgi:hypothetical protein